MVATLRQAVTVMSSCVPSLTCPDSHLSWINHLRRTNAAPTPVLAAQTRCSRRGQEAGQGGHKTRCRTIHITLTQQSSTEWHMRVDKKPQNKS